MRTFTLSALLFWPMYAYSDEIAPHVAPIVYALHGGVAWPT
jgi:hypothetical protein